MEFRDLANDRRIRRPALETDALRAQHGIAVQEEFDIADVRAEGGECSGVRGEGRLEHVWASDTDLAETELAPIELLNVSFVNVDLSNARWRKVIARQTEWLHCRMAGWQLDLDRATDVYLEGCRLDYAVIHVASVKGALVFRDCSLTGALIRGDLSQAVFTDCGFDQAEFDVTGAKGCDLRGSDLVGAQGLLNLRGAWLDIEQASSAAPRIAAEAGLVVVE